MIPKMMLYCVETLHDALCVVCDEREIISAIHHTCYDFILRT